MEFKKIFSGKGKLQVLHLGYRMMKTKGPLGQFNTIYYYCVEKNCNARMATTGDPKGEMKIKFHKPESHNHDPDISGNIVSSSLSEFRETVRSNPDLPVKSLYDDITSKAMKATEKPSDLEKIMPSFQAIRKQAYRARWNSKCPNYNINYNTLRRFKLMAKNAKLKKSERQMNEPLPPNMDGAVDKDDKLEFEVCPEELLNEERVEVKQETESMAPELVGSDESNPTSKDIRNDIMDENFGLNFDDNFNWNMSHENDEEDEMMKAAKKTKNLNRDAKLRKHERFVGNNCNSKNTCNNSHSVNDNNGPDNKSFTNPTTAPMNLPRYTSNHPRFTAKNTVSTPIRIDIGGTIFKSTLETLTAFPDSRLGRMFNGELPLTYDNAEDSYFLDCDGGVFRHILNYCRFKTLSLPEDFKEFELLYNESKFFDIPCLVSAVEERIGMGQSENVEYEYE